MRNKRRIKTQPGWGRTAVWTAGLVLAAMAGFTPGVFAATGQAVPVHHGRQSLTPAAYQDENYNPLENRMADWDPWAEMAVMHRQMERMMRHRLFAPEMTGMMGFGGDWAAVTGPRLEVENQAAAYVIKLDAPGMEKDQLDVRVTDEAITLSGERQSRRDEKNNGKIQWSERSYGRFVRSIPLPENAKPDGITAKYENGVLTVTVPKIRPEPVTEEQTRQIPIE